jgi:hypothetical protein
MITRPSTDALIADCCQELMEEILPALNDDTLRLRLIMTETVLRNAAVRAAHEIAWMREETTELLAYAAEVCAAAEAGAAPGVAGMADRDGRDGGGDGRDGGGDRRDGGGEGLRAALAAAEACPADSLHLADVAERYERAGEAFTQALAAAQRAGATDLVARARELLRDRIATEKQVMASYAVVGR